MEQKVHKPVRGLSHEPLPLIKCAVIRAEPSLTPRLFEQMTNGAESIVIIAFAAGTIPDRLAPVIKSKVDSAIPVFLISNNPGDDHGIERLKYRVQVNIAETGAIALKGVNINDIESVMKAIQEETRNGKKGAELGEVIGRRFGTTTR